MGNKGQSVYIQELLNKISQLENDYDTQGIELVELQTVAGSQIEMFAKIKQLQADILKIAKYGKSISNRIPDVRFFEKYLPTKECCLKKGGG